MGEIGGLLGKGIVGTAKRVIDPRTGQPSLGGFLTGDNMAYRSMIKQQSDDSSADALVARQAARQAVGANALAAGPEAATATGKDIREAASTQAAARISEKENLAKRKRKGLGGGGGLGNMLAASEAGARAESAAGLDPQRIQHLKDAQAQMVDIAGPIGRFTTPTQAGQTASTEFGALKTEGRTKKAEIRQQGFLKAAEQRATTAQRETERLAEQREGRISDRDLAQKRVDAVGDEIRGRREKVFGARIDTAKDATNRERDAVERGRVNEDAYNQLKVIKEGLDINSPVRKAVELQFEARTDPKSDAWTHLLGITKSEFPTAKSQVLQGELNTGAVTSLQQQYSEQLELLSQADEVLRDFDENTFNKWTQFWADAAGSVDQLTPFNFPLFEEDRVAVSKMRGQVGTLFGTIVKEQAGATQSPTEVERLKKANTNTEEDPLAAYIKLRVYQRHLKRSLSLKAAQMAAGGDMSDPAYLERLRTIGSDTINEVAYLSSTKEGSTQRWEMMGWHSDDKDLQSMAPNSTDAADLSPEQQAAELVGLGLLEESP